MRWLLAGESAFFIPASGGCCNQISQYQRLIRYINQIGGEWVVIIGKHRGNGGMLGSTDISFLLLYTADFGESFKVWVPLSRAVILMH